MGMPQNKAPGDPTPTPFLGNGLAGQAKSQLQGRQRYLEDALKKAGA